MNQLFTQLLKKKIETNKLSIREAARQIGVAHTTLIRSLEGNTIDIDTLIAISHWLQINPSDAMDSLITNETAKEKKIFLLFQYFPGLGEKLEQITEMIEMDGLDPKILEDVFEYIEFRLYRAKREVPN